uniref:Protein Atg16l2 n=1 Tax=Jaculus jaculus TaxID=51337 RepID=A0A8C5LBG8_JACJA
PCGPAARWKRHIVRQLRQRDRMQKALFLELVPAYNRLLEKAELLAKFSEELKLEPNSVTPVTYQGSWEEHSGPASEQVASPASLRAKWQQQQEGLQLVCGEDVFLPIRVNQAWVSKELKQAAQQIVNINESPDILEDGTREETVTLTPAVEPDPQESETCEKWKRSFSGSLHSAPDLPLPPSPQEAHLSEVNAVCFGPNSSLLATGGADQLIHLWNVVGGRLEGNQTLEGAGGSISSVDFDPSGSQVLAATYNQAAHLWKVGEAQSKETLSGHKDKVTAAKFKLTKHQAVTGSRDRTVKEWDLDRAYCSRTINVLSYCNDVVCGDHIIISGHNDQKIRFWDSRGPQCTQVIPVQGRVTSLSLSPDQLHLLSCSRDDTLKVIDLRVSNIRQVFRADGFRCGSDWTKASFSPDRSYALAGSWDGALYIWNVDTGKLENRLPGAHCAAVNAVAWCYSGSHIVSVDQARKVVLWY